MSRVLLMTIPAQGHLRPALAVAAELVSRGHEVDVTTTTEHVEQVAESRAVPLPYATTWNRADIDSDTAAHADVTSAEVAAWAPLVMLSEAAAQIVPVQRHLSRRPADVLLYDTTTRLPARVLAHRHDLPAVELHCSLAPPPGEVTIPDLRDPEDGTALVLDADHPARTEHRHRAERLLSEHGYPTLDPDEVARTPERRTLVAVADLLQPHLDAFDSSTVFTGLLDRPDPKESRWRPPADGRPVVLLTCGTEPPHPSAQRLAECGHALAATGFHAVLATGPVDPDTPELRNLGRHVEAAAWLPVPEVLDHAVAAVTHAGAGTTALALQRAVPSVVTPRTPEQAAIADRLVTLGLGTRMSYRHSSPADLVSAVRDLTSDAVSTDALDAARRRSREHRGAVAAVDVIEAAADDFPARRGSTTA